MEIILKLLNFNYIKWLGFIFFKDEVEIKRLGFDYFL